MSFRSRVVIIFAIAMSAVLPVRALDIGTMANNNPGVDAFGTPVGVYETVQVGNDELSGGRLGDMVGQGGNAVTVCFPNNLVADAAEFTITSTGCGGAGTQTIPLNASTVSELCTQIHAGIDQGCNWRNESCTDGGDGWAIDIVGPLFCDISNWEFFTATVPAAATTVDITGVTDIEAGNVDHFTLRENGVLISGDAGDFAAVTNGTQLAAAIDALSTRIDVTYSAGTLTITSTLTGPRTFSQLALEFITPATTASVDVTGVDDAQANVVNRFRLYIDGSPVNTSSLDYSAVSNGVQLAAVLDGVSGIDVTYDSAGDKLDFSASSPGDFVFTIVTLASVFEFTMVGGTSDYDENDPALLVDDGLSIGPSGTSGYAAVGANVWLDTYTDDDILDFTPGSGITGSYVSATGMLPPPDLRSN